MNGRDEDVEAAGGKVDTPRLVSQHPGLTFGFDAAIRVRIGAEAQHVFDGSANRDGAAFQECELLQRQGRELDVVIDDELIRNYRERFARLRVGLSRAARRVGAPFAYLSSATPVREMARVLAAAGVVEAA